MTVLPASGATTPEAVPQVPAPEYQLFREFGVGQVSGEGYGRRAVAKVIDFVVFNIVVFLAAIPSTVVLMVVGAAIGLSGDVVTARLGETTFMSLVLSTLTVISYFTIFEWLSGTTPGKLALGMAVVTEELEPCPLGAALKRNVLLLLELLAWSIPAFLAIRNSHRAQRHGDRWAGTIVARRADVPAVLWGSPGRFLIAGLAAVAAIVVLTGLSLLLKAIPAFAGA